MIQHGKMYRSSVNEKIRFNIFKNNLREIEAHNEKYEAGLITYKMGITKFTDMTSKEFSEMLNLQGKPMHVSGPPNISLRKTPEAIDWRTLGAVSHVKDQGECGACWSFSAVGALEGQYYLKYKNMVPMSEQYLIDCTNTNEPDGNSGCKSGSQDYSFEYLQTHGIPSEKDYPYQGKNGTCPHSFKYVLDKISGYTQLINEEELQNAVGTIGPVSVSVNSEGWQFYDSGVYLNKTCSTDVNHGVVAVGYGSENGQDYWILKNSWGEDFGEKGYIRMARGINQCGIAMWGSIPTL